MCCSRELFQFSLFDVIMVKLLHYILLVVNSNCACASTHLAMSHVRHSPIHSHPFMEKNAEIHPSPPPLDNPNTEIDWTQGHKTPTATRKTHSPSGNGITDELFLLIQHVSKTEATQQPIKDKVTVTPHPSPNFIENAATPPMARVKERVTSPSLTNSTHGQCEWEGNFSQFDRECSNSTHGRYEWEGNFSQFDWECSNSTHGRCDREGNFSQFDWECSNSTCGQCEREGKFSQFDRE